jgi:polyisoprenoid-binding protein YceI
VVPRALAAAAAVLFVSAAAAAPTRYTIEPNHTYPSFKAPHLGISFWNAKFTKSSGEVTLDREAKTGTVDIVIDAASVEFGHKKMNEHAVGPDFFNAGKYPQITYQGTIQFTGDQPSKVVGEMTLLGVTQPLELIIESFACTTHPMLKKEICGAAVSGGFDRKDYGMTKYADGPAGAVTLDIQVEALKAD